MKFYFRTNPYNISTTGNWMLKAEAMLQKEKWIENRISKIDKANKQECIICQLIQQNLPSQMHSKLLQELSNGVKGHKIHNLFFILKKYKKYRLTFIESIHLLLICIFK